MAVIDVSDTTFEQEVLASELPVLIEFHADWCGPCKQLGPIVEEVAGEVEGKIKVVRVDVDRARRVAMSFRVQSIPQLFLIHEGRLVGQKSGLIDKKTLLQMLEPVLPASASELSAEDLAALIMAGRALPVDIRDASSYGRHRIPRAIHIPKAELSDRVAELRPTDGRLRVLYGRSEAEAKEIAEVLQEKGLEVAYLKGGFLFWEADGLPVESPDDEDEG